MNQFDNPKNDLISTNKQSTVKIDEVKLPYSYSKILGIKPTVINVSSTILKEVFHKVDSSHRQKSPRVESPTLSKQFDCNIINNQLSCDKCGTIAKGNDIFCCNCFNALDFLEKLKDNTEVPSFCEACREKVLKDEIFCSQCGEPV